ncbi:MAG: cytochrome c peroxidase [Bacteroidota bacterium]
MNNRFLLILLSISLLFNACKKDDDTTAEGLDGELEAALLTAADGKGVDFFQLPDSDDFANIPQDPKNPLTAQKVALGKLLYHETGLGISPELDIGKETFSCASCHFAAAGFQAGRFQGIGDGGVGFGVNGEGREVIPDYEEMQLDVQPIRSPTVLNTAYQEVMLWNGQFGATGVNAGTESQWTAGTPKEVNNLGYQGLEIQAIAGLEVHRLSINEDLMEELGYKPIFDMVFADVPADSRYTREFAGLAIAAYERTVLSNKSPFQEWLKGNRAALSEQEKRGALLFFSEANCYSCHTGPALSTMEFHAIGMKDLQDCPEPIFRADAASAGANLGRGGFTGNATDNYKFKVPQLYNLSDSPFFGHGSSMRSIRDVLEYKNKAEAENANVPATQLAASFVPLQLSDEEISDIEAFINTGLYDSELSRYEPASVLSGQCFPNNDPLSRLDLGCD